MRMRLLPVRDDLRHLGVRPRRARGVRGLDQHAEPRPDIARTHAVTRAAPGAEPHASERPAVSSLPAAALPGVAEPLRRARPATVRRRDRPPDHNMPADLRRGDVPRRPVRPRDRRAGQHQGGGEKTQYDGGGVAAVLQGGTSYSDVEIGRSGGFLNPQTGYRRRRPGSLQQTGFGSLFDVASFGT
jgi:hypothetical protein